MSYDEAWGQSSSINQKTGHLKDTSWQSTLLLCGMQSLHVPDFQKLDSMWEARAPCQSSRSESKPTTRPIHSFSYEDYSVKWIKEESRDQSRDRWLFLHVSFYLRGDEDTEFPKFLAGHPGLRDRVKQIFFLVFRTIYHCQFSIMFWMPTLDNPYLPNGLPFKLHNQVQMALEGQATDLWDSK